MSTPPKLIRLHPDGSKDTGLEPLELEAADFQSPLPTQHLHLAFEDPDIGLNVGVWDTTTMQEAFGPYPGDEFIWVLEGGFAMIDGDGGAMPAGQGDCVAFRNAAPMSWKQEGYLKKFFITLLDPQAAVPQINTADGAVVVMDPDAPMKDVSETPAAMERDAVLFTNDAGTMNVGLWECENADFGMAPFTIHEFVVVLEGDAYISEPDGTEHHVKAGDCFFIPKGTECHWKIPNRIKKYYAQIDVG